MIEMDITEDTPNEEIRKWKEERIRSLQTPELSSGDEKKDCKQERQLLDNIDTTPTKKKRNALNEAIKENGVLKSKLLYVTKENTSLLKEISKLKQKQMNLEDNLKEISVNPRHKQETEVDPEYDKLIATVKQQHNHIELLKIDIQRLRSKCGHVSKDTMLSKRLVRL